MSRMDVESRFGINGKKEKSKEMSKEFMLFALFLDSYLPDSREKFIAMERLEDAYMWSKSAITSEE